MELTEDKKCPVCSKLIKRSEFQNDYWFKMTNYCSESCGKIFRAYKRKFPNHKFDRAYAIGMLFELFVAKDLEGKNWYVFRTINSRGIFDIIAIKNNKVKCYQVTRTESPKSDFELDRINKFKKSNPKIEVKIVTPKQLGLVRKKDTKKLEKVRLIYAPIPRIKNAKKPENVKGIVRKVWMNKASKQLLATLPKDKKIEEGDYVEVNKIS